MYVFLRGMEEAESNSEASVGYISTNVGIKPVFLVFLSSSV